MEIEYNELQPDARLKGWVDRYWSFSVRGRSGEVSPEQCCIPLGMAELMVHLREPFSEGLYKGRWTAFPKAYITGISMRPMVWHMAAPGCMIGVRLKPEGVLRLFNISLAGDCDSFAEVDTRLSTDEQERFRSVIKAAEPGPAIEALEAFLLEQLTRRATPTLLFVDALHRMREQNVRWCKGSMYEQLYVGDRQMQRLFKDHLGLSPKAYFKLMRFREAYDRTRDQREVDWIGLAELLGYSDQPHLVRDFKRFCGASPRMFLQQDLPRFQRPVAEVRSSH